jgi:hypothetical protein
MVTKSNKNQPKTTKTIRIMKIFSDKDVISDQASGDDNDDMNDTSSDSQGSNRSSFDSYDSWMNRHEYEDQK